MLRNRQIDNHKFVRQHPIGPYVADFACTELGLIVELDGGQHALQEEYDQRRTAFSESSRIPGFAILESNGVPGDRRGFGDDSAGGGGGSGRSKEALIYSRFRAAQGWSAKIRNVGGDPVAEALLILQAKQKRRFFRSVLIQGRMPLISVSLRYGLNRQPVPSPRNRGEG